MRVHLQYGTDGLETEFPDDGVTVLAPRYVEGLPDEAAAFRAAAEHPIDAPPLSSLVHPGERVALVIPDITRPLPTARLLPWVLEALGSVDPDDVVIVNGTGSHRVNTPSELVAMVGEDVYARYRVVNHDAHNPATLALAGTGIDGQPVLLQRDYVEADRRIVLGFIEPHFMAGFSGGCKGIFPAVADIGAIMRYHDAATIAHPRSTWGVLDGNPTQARIRHDGGLLPVDFCVNVTLNRDHRITRFFCGDVRAAHEEGCRFSRDTAMVACERPFPIVVTTNSGYPLDQNLYQAVKGMSAAAQIVSDGGLIVAAARCNDGFPAHGNFRPMLFGAPSPRELLDTILAPGFSMYDQWQAQLLALIQLKARVALKSELDPDDVVRAHILPIGNVGEAVRDEQRRAGGSVPIAVLPEGPMTIPYLSPGAEVPKRVSSAS